MLFKLNCGSYFTDKKARNVAVRPVRKLWIYKTRREKNNIYKYGKSCRLSEFKQYFGINKTNRVVGITPDYVGSRPSKIVRCRNFFTDHFLKRHNYLLSDNFSDVFKQDIRSSISESRIVLSGGYDSCDEHLKAIFKDNREDCQFDINEYFKNIEKWGITSWFETPEVSFYDKKELLYNIRVNEEANPGHYTSQLISKVKSETTFVARSVAAKIYELLKKQPVKNTYLWTLSKREKDIKVCGNDEAVSTRVVLFCEDPMTTLLMWFSQKILTGLNSCKNKFNISGDYTYAKAEKIYSRSKDYDWYIDTDWKLFDSNQDTKFIEAALLLCTSGFPDDFLHKNIRNLIIQSSVTKYVALPPGVVVELNRANASGHPFTTLLNCNVNVIYWTLILNKIYGDNFKEFSDIEVYGDDGLIFFKDHPNLSKIDEIISEVGLSSESLSGRFVPTNMSCESNAKPDFLKRRFSSSGISWNLKKMFDRLFYQVRKRNVTDQLELLRSYVLTSSFNEDVHKYAVDFYEFLKSCDELNNVDPDVLSNFEKVVLNKLEYKEFVSIYSCYYDSFLNSDYVKNTIRLYSHAVSVFLPGYNLNKKFTELISSNDYRTDMLYYLAFDKDYITDKDNIYKVGRERMNIFGFGDAYIKDMQSWCEGQIKGITSFFNRIR